MQTHEQIRNASVLYAILITLAFSVFYRFDKEMNELKQAQHPLETFYVR